MDRISSTALLWLFYLSPVSFEDRIFARRPSISLRWIENLQRSSIDRRSTTDLQWIGNLQKVFYGQEIFHRTVLPYIKYTIYLLRKIFQSKSSLNRSYSNSPSLRTVRCYTRRELRKSQEEDLFKYILHISDLTLDCRSSPYWIKSSKGDLLRKTSNRDRRKKVILSLSKRNIF